MKILKKIKRELVVILSKICLKSARNDYFGLDLRYPIIYGMGRGYVIPAEAWMGECLQVFVETKSGCVIDAGVNVGLYLVKLRAISDEIEYVGFEPNAVCNFYTNELIRLNGFKNSKVLPLALSDSHGIKTLYANRLGDKGASLIYETKNPGNVDYSFDICTVPGDEYIDLLKIDEVSAIKIDVEGAELLVLKGLKNTIEKCRPYMYTEVWPEYENDEGANIEKRISGIYEFLSACDYSILGVDCDNNLDKLQSVDDLKGKYNANYLFVPNEMMDVFISKIKLIDKCEISVGRL